MCNQTPKCQNKQQFSDEQNDSNTNKIKNNMFHSSAMIEGIQE